MVNTNELLSPLKSRITDSQRNAPRNDTVTHISRYNRDTLLRHSGRKNSKHQDVLAHY